MPDPRRGSLGDDVLGGDGGAVVGAALLAVGFVAVANDTNEDVGGVDLFDLQAGVAFARGHVVGAGLEGVNLVGGGQTGLAGITAGAAGESPSRVVRGPGGVIRGLLEPGGDAAGVGADGQDEDETLELGHVHAIRAQAGVV